MIINRYGEYLRTHFGHPIYKITVDAGFTCPNRDGSKGYGGCTYCNNDKFFPTDKYHGLTPREQALEKISKRKNKSNEKYIIYFQTYSNTYGDIDTLKRIYSSVLDIDSVMGISIGTRVDCINEEILTLLQEIARKYYVCLEYGLESIEDSTLLKINRGHSVSEFVETVLKTQTFGIDICAHLMFGFPWENREIAKRSATFINQLPIKFIKIHQLQIVKNSVMAKGYLAEPFPLLSKTQYLDYLCDFLTELRDDCIIQRVAGDCPSDILIGSGFDEKSHVIQSELENRLVKSGLFQGINFRGKNELSKIL